LTFLSLRPLANAAITAPQVVGTGGACKPVTVHCAGGIAIATLRGVLGV